MLIRTFEPKLVFLKGRPGERVVCWLTPTLKSSCADELCDLVAGDPVILLGESAEEYLYYKVLCRKGVGWVFHVWLPVCP